MLRCPVKVKVGNCVIEDSDKPTETLYISHLIPDLCLSAQSRLATPVGRTSASMTVPT